MVDLGPLAPWPPVFPWPPAGDWIRIASVLDEATGEFVPLPGEIHRDDPDWLCRSWQPVLEIERIVRAAARGPASAGPARTQRTGSGRGRQIEG
jgi:hypothetical protein